MSAIRPLATIAALMVLGYILWQQINTPDLQTSTENQLAMEEGVPPVEFDFGAGAGVEPGPPAFESSAPPAFEPAMPIVKDTPPTVAPVAPPQEPEFDFGPVPDSAVAGGITPLSPEDTSAMPELPPLPTPTGSGNTAVVPAPAPENSIDSMALPPIAESSQLPPIESNQAPLDEDLTSMARAEMVPLASGFAKEKPAINDALARGELEQAHLLLTKWYGDRSLPPAEQSEVEELLSQLAGSVIYSTNHSLESPHVVRQGETLETIGQVYGVPWQLLAKINGVSQSAGVQPGQELKVIQGPFSAVVDVERQQLALLVSERYAGRFNVKTEGQAANEGAWVVTQKQMPNGVTTDSKVVILEPEGGSTGTQLVLGPASDTGPRSAGAIRVAPQDQNDLFDILSIGSRVMIRK
ncbi:LysM peptidoglycan-binding domain-containing protein [Aeoliella mucimassa]|uniref:LysM domain protein n=1 Tax=Aeoliella mucimassa TaxID=2527972 RepID=A0A518AL73_9BACT|nr:LysM domain-containing protein [Aeoliella mucimassa]QDU55485.1 LysM domain protein [Aeoliella mucimassa]